LIYDFKEENNFTLLSSTPLSVALTEKKHEIEQY